MKFKFVILSILISNLTSSCEEAQVLEINSSSESLLVVDALITNENKRHEVKLSQTFGNLNDSPAMVSDAIVVLVEGNDRMFLEQDVNRPGVYLTDSLRALFGKLYTLFILYDNKEYFAVTASNFGTPIESLVFAENSDDTFEYIYQESSEPSMMEVLISWSEPEKLEAKEIHAFYYTLNVINVNQIFAPDKERIIFPKGAQIFRRKYSLTTDHQEFLRSFLSEVDWRGGPFDVAPGNVKTNLSEGAVGYFAVSMVQTDVTIVN